METCKRCEGSGWCRDAILIRQEPCEKCNGTGKIRGQGDDPVLRQRLAELAVWDQIFTADE